jgi:hypothetical protein
MSATVWYFVETASGGMKRLPAARMFRFVRRKQALDEGGPAGVRVIEVILTVDRRTAVAVHRVICPRYETGADGFHDRAHREEAVELAMRVVDVGAWLRPENVVGLDRHIAMRDTEQRHRWVPSGDQLQEVANLLNGAAVAPPVVAVVGSELVPV